MQVEIQNRGQEMRTTLLIAFLSILGFGLWFMKNQSTIEPNPSKKLPVINLQKGSLTIKRARFLLKRPLPIKKLPLLKKPTLLVLPSIKLFPLKKEGLKGLLLKINPNVWGTFPDGSQLKATTVQKKSPTETREHPNGSKLWRVYKDGRREAFAPKLDVAYAIVAQKTGRVALVTEHGQLHLSDENGKQPVQKIESKVGYHPSFSPNGNQLSFVKKQGMDRHMLTLYDPQSKKRIMLVREDMGISTPVFSPDGQWIVYSSSQTGIASLWKVEIKSFRSWQVTNRGIEPGKGLPSHFVPTPSEGPLLWAGGWIVYNAGDGLWTVHETGKKAKKISQAIKAFHWFKVGKSLKVQDVKGMVKIIQLPTDRP